MRVSITVFVLRMSRVRGFVALFSVCVLSLLCACLSDGAGDGGDCTRGFMSRDRMDKVLNNVGDLVVASNLQGIFPEVGFTCSGRIHAWVFGARWRSSSASVFTELQIWRPTGDGLYTKVGNTTIMTQSNGTYYYYMLPAPLDFQAGDVLGYHQPDPLQDQLKLYFERNKDRVGKTGYYYRDSGPASELYIPEGVKSDEDEILVNVITDSPGCLHGFMSLERIRLLLNVDRVSSITIRDRRQQISPEMNFTCNGTITKWIIGADSFFGVNRHLYPELQVWRNIGNSTYVKISGTYIFLPFADFSDRIYYEFTPIEVQTGDILGVFTPDDSYSRIFLLSEGPGGSNRPAQYYHSFSDRTLSSSNIDVIDIENNMTRATNYYPMVSVEFMRSPTTSVTVPPGSTMITVATHTSTAPLPSSDPSHPSITESSSQSAAVAAGVGAGIAVFLVLIILVVLVVILVMFLLLRGTPKSKPAVVEQEKTETPGTSQCVPMTPLGEIYEVPQEREGEETHDTAQDGVINTLPNAAYSLV